MPIPFKFSWLLAAQTATVATAPKHFHDWSFWLAVVLFLAGLLCDGLVIVRFAQVSQLKVPTASWGLDELKVVATALLSLLFVTNSVYSFTAWIRHVGVIELAPLIIPTELFLRIAVLAGLALFLRRRQIGVMSSLGLASAKPAHAVGWGLVFGLASLPPVALIIATCERLCRLLGIQPSDQPIAELFLSSRSPVLVLLLTLFALIVAPVFEEVIFRGFAYPALKQRWGATRAMAIVSAVFALTHLHAPSFIPLLVLAVGLSLAYELTGSLLTPITMHALFNTVMVVKLVLERRAT